MELMWLLMMIVAAHAESAWQEKSDSLVNGENGCAWVCNDNSPCTSPPLCPTVQCPKVVCPKVDCPNIQCPPQPVLKCPQCKQPVCPPLPPIPACPQPLVNLTCPEYTCVSPSRLQRKMRPPGYEGWPGAPAGLYKLHNVNTPWFVANETCSKEGAHLFIPNSKVELSAVLEIMKLHKITLINIGFHDNDKKGQFVDVLGEPMDSVQRAMWGTNQPGGNTNEYCTSLVVYDGIHDYSCSTEFPFVCEVPY